jgi:LacI family transcriptional regulator
MKIQGPATIKDIARELNISMITVSRALRDTHGVSKLTRERVLEKAKQLNYKINYNARGLKVRKTNKIGVIIPHVSSYYFSTVITGIQNIAFEAGYNVILYVTGDSFERELEILDSIHVSSIDGLLICTTGTETDAPFKDFIKTGLPIVFFDNIVDDVYTSKVTQNNYKGAFMATEFLIKKGYKNIAHLNAESNAVFTKNRLNGYLDALKKYSIPVNEDWIIYSDFSLQSGEVDVKKLWSMKSRPDAIFALSDRKAVGAIMELKRRKVRVGREVGVIGFTNDPISTIITPTLSTIEEHAIDIGEKSCALLVKHIKKSNFIPEKIVLDCKLIERESTDRR